jgi:hypothetical protein
VEGLVANGSTGGEVVLQKVGVLPMDCAVGGGSRGGVSSLSGLSGKGKFRKDFGRDVLGIVKGEVEVGVRSGVVKGIVFEFCPV